MRELFFSILMVTFLSSGIALCVSGVNGASVATEATQDKLSLSWEQTVSDAQKLAQKLKETGKSWNKVVGVARGGVIPAVIVAHELGIHRFDTISIRSYDDKTKTQGKLEVLNGTSTEDSNILVIEDLADTGRTLQEVRKMLPNAFIATLYTKPQGKGMVDFSLAEVSQNTWIVFPWEKD